MRAPRRRPAPVRAGVAPRAGRRPPRPRIRTKRRWPRALAALGIVLAIWILWPAPEEAGGHGAAPPVKVAGAAPEKPERPAPVRPVAAHALAAAKKPAQPPPLLRARRDLLLAAVRARAASLRPCVPANAQEAHVPVRLHVLRAGAVKSVEFAGEPPAAAVRDCVRRVAGGWNFRDVELPADVELFATLALTPGA